MSGRITIRRVTEQDAAEVLAIYAPYIISTPVTFEYDVPTVDEFKERIKTNTREYPWLVCIQNDKIIGYAYASKYRQRIAYQWAVESTVYLSPGVQRKGIAGILYKTLFSLLRIQGYITAYAIVTTPNEQSEGFHRSMGFNEFAIFRNVGYKLGKWHDVKWFELFLNPITDNPSPPILSEKIEKKKEYEDILKQANEQIEVKIL